MNTRKGYILASLGLIFLVGSILLGTPLRGPSEAAVAEAVRGIKVLVTNDDTVPVPVRQVGDPLALRRPFAKWINVDLSKGDAITKAHFFDVPAGFTLVVEYANVDMCTMTDVADATINLIAGYKDPTTGQMFDQHIKLITQRQGIFPDEDNPDALYLHFGVSQQMILYLQAGSPVDAWIYHTQTRPGHSEANVWLSGYLIPAPAGQ